MTLSWACLLICVVANVSGNMAFKRAVAHLPPGLSLDTVRAALVDPFLWLGFACAGVVLGTYLYALREVPIGIAYPVVTSLAMIGVAIGGAALFGEALSFQAMLGVGLVLAGVLTLFLATA